MAEEPSKGRAGIQVWGANLPLILDYRIKGIYSLGAKIKGQGVGRCL